MEFEVAEMTVEMGEDFYPPMLWNPKNLAVTYSSSDMSVATVDDNGVLYISSPGTTTITASYEGDYYTLPGSASYELNVCIVGVDELETQEHHIFAKKYMIERKLYIVFPYGRIYNALGEELGENEAEEVLRKSKINN